MIAARLTQSRLEHRGARARNAQSRAARRTFNLKYLSLKHIDKGAMVAPFEQQGGIA
jgi:hypothetical protein